MNLRFSGHARREMASDRISEADSDTSLRRETSSSNTPMTARGRVGLCSALPEARGSARSAAFCLLEGRLRIEGASIATGNVRDYPMPEVAVVGEHGRCQRTCCSEDEVRVNGIS